MIGFIRSVQRRKRSSSQVFGAVELGSSKIVVLVAEHQGDSLRIIGAGEEKSVGIRQGVIVDSLASAEALGRAVAKAEAAADVWLDRIFLSLSGRHVGGCRHEGLVRVGGVDGRVSEEDLANATALSRARTLPKGRCLIHHVPGEWNLDGKRLRDAAGLSGELLRRGSWIVDADAARVSDILHQTSSLGLQVQQVVLAGLASAAAVTTPEERVAGVLVLDLGAGTTDYALYRNGFAVRAGVVGVGGDHVTKDLSVALRLSIAEAESVKRLFGRAQCLARRDDKVWLSDERGVGGRRAGRLGIEQVVTARVREILSIVRQQLGTDYAPEELRAGVVITGGLSALPGVLPAAASVFGADVRAGLPSEWLGQHLAEPGYSTVSGALLEGCRLQLQTPFAPPAPLHIRLLQAMDYILRPGDPRAALPELRRTTTDA
jgi:cell division protein FtsA